MIWAKEETMSRAEIQALQLDRLKETVMRVYETVPAYRRKMDAAGVKPQDIRELSDLKHLPFITKQDMRDNYPFGLFAVPKEELVRIHASSGTTGKPTVVGYTRRTWTSGRRRWPGLPLWAAPRKRMWHRSALDTGCSLGRWGFITGWKK